MFLPQETTKIKINEGKNQDQTVSQWNRKQNVLKKMSENKKCFWRKINKMANFWASSDKGKKKECVNYHQKWKSGLL